MKEFLISKRYSVAFLQLVKAKDHQTILKDIEILKTLMREEKNLIRILESILTPYKQKIELVKLVSNNLENKIWFNFFKILIQKQRFGLLNFILNQIESAIYREQKVKRIKLTLARKHKNKIINSIKAFLRPIYNKDLIFELHYNKDLMGGFIAESDSLTVDASIKKNLEKFVQSLET